jgi:8-oxo-dGTP diphosphatase
VNPYESGSRKNIPAVLVYARNRGRFLMIHRNTGGYHAGKWNGLGGKSELDESACQTAAREFEEESGVRLDPSRFQSLGVLQFPNFKERKAEDWTVFVFSSELSDDEVARAKSSGNEGSLHWIEEKELLSLELWPGDRLFLPRVIERKPFLGTIWYRNSEVIRHEMRYFGE